MSDAARAPDGGLTVGSTIDGRYRIDGVLGSGGMGRVYRGEHTGIGRAVAIKVLHADLGGNREAVTRFQREALASGRLDHPNIVAVSDFGELPDGAAFLVMEALEGEPLGARLGRGRLPWREALAVLRGVLAGLAHAHERGVVHRDIKPDNVFLAKKDDQLLVKVLDFGIAKLFAGVTDDPATTRAGLTIGTPAYLSPEQAVGGEITPATDLYSATVVLFEMLTGRAPFEAEDPLQMLGAHAAGVPPLLVEVAPGLELPAGMEELVKRGLAKRGAERHASALAYLAAIDAMAGDSKSVFASQPVAVVVGAPQDLDTSDSRTRPLGALAPGEHAPAAGEQIAPPFGGPGGRGRAAAGDPTAPPVGGAAVRGQVAAGETPAVIGSAPTVSLTPLPAAMRAATLGEAASEPVPRSWLVIGGVIVSGAVLLAIVLALASGSRGDHAISADAALALVAPPVPAPMPPVADGRGLPADGSAAEGRRGTTDGRGSPADGSAAEGRRGVLDGRGSPADGSAAEGRRGPIDAQHEAHLKAALHQLETSRNCADRHAAVAKLLALGDARAIAPLQAARVRTFGRSHENVNACLAADAEAAAKALTAQADAAH